MGHFYQQEMLWQILVTTIFGLTDAWWQCDGLGPWGNAKQQIKAARPSMAKPRSQHGKGSHRFVCPKKAWMVSCDKILCVYIYIYILLYYIYLYYIIYIYIYVVIYLFIYSLIQLFVSTVFMFIHTIYNQLCDPCATQLHGHATALSLR